jgi:hypothetical protein
MQICCHGHRTTGLLGCCWLTGVSAVLRGVTCSLKQVCFGAELWMASCASVHM